MKLAVGLVGSVALILGSLILFAPESKTNPTSQVKQEQQVQPKQELPAQPTLTSNTNFKVFQSAKTITLEAANTVVLRGPVSGTSVTEVMAKMEELRQNLSDNEPIYLVLDTPGGSVIAGMDLIDYMKSLPNKVQTITLFAASMGFQIVQNMDTRYISETGTLMSHRASGGVEGQFDGELESQYKMIKRKIDYLDTIASKRMGKSLTEYKAMIKDEYWVSGFDSVDEKAADEKVNLRCGKSLSGSETQEVQVMFFTLSVDFSKCPLLRGPLKVNKANVPSNQQAEVERLINLGFRDHREFLKDSKLINNTDKYFQ